MVASFDKDSHIKAQAGIQRLSTYINYYEIQILCKILNKTDEQVLKMNDVYATKVLLSNKESINFESRYYDIKSKQKK